jgi:preprotein translocase subunit SecD
MRFVRLFACLLLLSMFMAIGSADEEGAIIESLPIERSITDKKTEQSLFTEEADLLVLVRPEGVIAQLSIDPEKILEKQFKTGSIERLSNKYVVSVNGSISTDLMYSLGYTNTAITVEKNITKIQITQSPESIIVDYLKSTLDADVKPIGVPLVGYEILSNVSQHSLNDTLAEVDGFVFPGKDGLADGISIETAYEIDQILYGKFKRIGMKDFAVRVLNNSSLLIHLSDMELSAAMEIMKKPGIFEIRISSGNNKTVHVLYGDDVESVGFPGLGCQDCPWGVPIMLSEEGGYLLQRDAIGTGATEDPCLHPISMFLDGEEIYNTSLADDLALSLQKSPQRVFKASMDPVGPGWEKARELYFHIKRGVLPVKLRIIWAKKGSTI